MSIETVVMPDVGDIAQAVVIEWLHPIGTSLAEGDDLLEVETEKATFVIPAPVSGRLTAIHQPNGSTVETGQALGEMEIA